VSAYSFLKCGPSIRAATLESKVSLAWPAVEKAPDLSGHTPGILKRLNSARDGRPRSRIGNIRAHVEKDEQSPAEIAEFQYFGATC